MEILKKALNIGKKTKFKVRIYNSVLENQFIEQELTYIELGTYLVSKSINIKRIDVIEKLK